MSIYHELHQVRFRDPYAEAEQARLADQSRPTPSPADRWTARLRSAFSDRIPRVLDQVTKLPVPIRPPGVS